MSEHEQTSSGLDWVDPTESWDFGDAGERPQRKQRDGSLWSDTVTPAPSGGERDIAGTHPRHDPDSLLPPLEAPDARGDVVDGTAIEEDAEGRPLPTHERPKVPAGSSTLQEGHGSAWQDPSAAGRSRHSARFNFAKGALAALGVAAVVGAVSLAAAAASDGDEAVDNWTAWKPDKSIKASIPLQIGAFLGPRYKLSTGEQIVDVTGTDSLVIEGLEAGVAVRKPAAAGGEIVPIDSSKTTVYDMCGYGADCGIATGKPSEERALMIRREALELALYTFHYTKAEYTVVKLPPARHEPSTAVVDERIKQGLSRSKAEEAVTTNPALFLRRETLQNVLDQPLAAALTPTPPRVLDIKTAPDEANVLDLTSGAEAEQTTIQNPQDGHPYLVLKLQG